MASPDNVIPVESEKVEAELIAQLLGSDPWMRFDLWANRAWEATELAMSIAADRSSSMSEDSIDSRILASFHAAQIAKDFAEMVNPLFAAAEGSRSGSLPSAAQAQAILSMVLDDED
jgi:hypothetical protein